MILFNKYCFYPVVYQCCLPVMPTCRPYPQPVFNQRQHYIEPQETVRFTGGKG